MIITKIGYYISEGRIYEDWHAGILMKYEIFTAYSFLDNGDILVASSKAKIDCNKYNFRRNEFKRSTNSNHFELNPNSLDMYRMNKQFYQKFIVEDLDTLVDEYGNKYTFTLWNDFLEE